MQFDDDDEPPRRGLVAAVVATAGALAVAGFITHNALNQADPVASRPAHGKVVTLKPPRKQPPAPVAAAESYPGTHMAVEVPEGLGELIAGLAEPGDELGLAPEENLVAQVQRALAEEGIYDGPVDGMMNDQVRAAVEVYQDNNAMPVTGIVTQPLVDHIQFVRRIAEATAVEPWAPAEPPPAASEVEVEDEGDDAGFADRIRLVQTGLAELGYIPGPIDGTLSELTSLAIREFEHERGLPETGALSERLIEELRKMSGLASITAQ